jgi:hypothetical protein
MVYSYIIAIALIFIPTQTILSSGKIYSPSDSSKKIYGQKKKLTKQQKIHQGIDVKPKMTLCRLKKRVKTRSGEEVCIYEGGNRTFEMAIENKCPRSYQCEYNPYGEPPNIDSVIESLNEIKD